MALYINAPFSLRRRDFYSHILFTFRRKVARRKKGLVKVKEKVHQRFRMFFSRSAVFGERSIAVMIAPISLVPFSKKDVLFPEFDNIFALRDSRREERRSLEG